MQSITVRILASLILLLLLSACDDKQEPRVDEVSLNEYQIRFNQMLLDENNHDCLTPDQLNTFQAGRDFMKNNQAEAEGVCVTIQEEEGATN